MKFLLIKSHSLIKSGLGYTSESSSTANISKEVKFVKSKESMIAATNAEKVKPKKK